MTAKIRELKLDDIKTVAGGAKAPATSSTHHVSTSTSAVAVKPLPTSSWSEIMARPTRY